MKKLFTQFYVYFWYINFYDFLDFKLNNLNSYINKMMNLDLNEKIWNKQILVDDKIHPEIMEEINEVQSELIRLDKLTKEFAFEFNYSYYISFLTSVIFFCCLNFVLANYINIEVKYYTITFICLNLFYVIFSLFVYRYCVKQTSIYYEQFI